jgi:hypothetical protein
MGSASNTAHREPWNKGKIVGQKAPFKLKDIWALRVRPTARNGRPPTSGDGSHDADGMRQLNAEASRAAPQEGNTRGIARVVSAFVAVVPRHAQTW